MQTDPYQLVHLANQKKKIFEYRQAYDLFKQAISVLFENLKQEKDSETKSLLKQTIDELLTQAEWCGEKLKPSNPPLPQTSSPSKFQTMPKFKTKPQAQTRPQTSDPLRKMIEDEILDSSASVTWDDIAGLDSAKSTLREAIIMPSQFPHLFTGIRAPPKGILLFGPPGTGKTLLAKAVAYESRACFLSISAASLTSKFFGEAEKLVRAMFAVARERQPSIVFIDEIDSILSSRSEGQHDASRRLQTEFLVQMDGVKESDQDRVVIVGATNRPQELDEAVRRRFTKRVLIDLPNGEARRRLILHALGKVDFRISNKEFEDLVKLTQGYSGSDLAALCKEAAMVPLRNASEEQMKSGNISPVTLESFVSSTSIIRPSVSKRSLQFYQNWNKEFGSL